MAAVTLTAAALVGAGKVAQAGYQKWNEPAMSDEQMSEMTAATIDHIEDQMDHFERNGSKKGTVLAITMERDQNGDGVYEGEPTDDHANLYVNKKKGVGGFCGGSITGHDSGDEGVSHFYITLDTVEGWIREAQPNDK